MDGIGDESWDRLVQAIWTAFAHLTLAVEDVSAEAFADGHAQVDVQANPGDAHAGVILVLGQQEGIVMVMVVVVGMASMPPGLRGVGHGGRGKVSSAMYCGGPVEKGRCVRWELEVLDPFRLRLRAKDAQFGAEERLVSVTW